jgi:hypothetical protein
VLRVIDTWASFLYAQRNASDVESHKMNLENREPL